MLIFVYFIRYVGFRIVGRGHIPNLDLMIC